MQGHLDQLELVLGHQVAALTAVKNWLPRKIELVKSNRLAELEAFNQREDEQVQRLQAAEAQRHALITMIALELGLDAQLPLQDLLAHLPASHQESLAARAEQLKGLIAQIRDGQALVSELLRVSLDYVHFSIDIFAQLAQAAPPTGYGDLGAASPPPGGSWLVDRQA